MKIIIAVALLAMTLTATAGFRKKYIAEVNVAISVDQDKLVFNSAAKDEDRDDEFTCELEITKGAQFLFQIQRRRAKNILALKNDNITLALNKTKGSTKDGLIGTWTLKERVYGIQTITEIKFKSLEEMSITKTCNLD